MYWIAGLVGIALAAVLLAPVRFRAMVVKAEAAVWQVEARWLFGLAAFSWDREGVWAGVGSLRWKLPDRREEKRRPEVPWQERLRALPKQRRWFVDERRAVARLIKDIWQATEFRVRGEGWYGCDDPAVTAWLCAAVSIVRAMARMNLRLEPDFCQVGWAGRFEAEGRWRLIAMVAPAARFAVCVFVKPVIKKYRGGRMVWQIQR